jgi:hypothetical protein
VAVVWELIPATSISKQYGRFVAAPSGGEYGQVTRYDQVPPLVKVQLEARNVPPEEAQPIRNKALRKGTEATFLLNMTDPATQSAIYITGVILDYADQLERGTWDYTIRVEIERTDLNVPQAQIVDTTPPGGLHL